MTPARVPINPVRAVTNAAEVFTTYDAGGQLHNSGRVVGYYEEPTYVIQRSDGTRYTWAARLTFEQTLPRCASTRQSYRCDKSDGHEGPHTAPFPARGGTVHDPVGAFWTDA